MARIIKLRGEGHKDIQQLLPWYVAGRLDPSERAEVEAHLAACPECQAEVRFEDRLNAEMSDLPASVDQSWDRMRRRMDRAPRRRARADAVQAWIGRVGRAPLLGWALAAPALLLVVAIAVTAPSLQDRYHALGAASASPKGNAVVMFRPDLTEKALRQTLAAEDARIVDGPTAAGGYVLQLPPAHRDAALARLRGSADIVLAQPIDAGVGR